jgi:hypothetical protein
MMVNFGNDERSGFAWNIRSRLVPFGILSWNDRRPCIAEFELEIFSRQKREEINFGWVLMPAALECVI